MSCLPDHVLLQVLGCYLPLADVLTARLVCKRWERLARHRDVWRRRDLTFDRSTVPALRIAPCVNLLGLSSGYGSSLRSVGLLAVDTNCAAAELYISVDDAADLFIASLAIRRQASLGRLQKLGIDIATCGSCRRGLLDLLKEILRVEGLRRISVDFPEDIVSCNLSENDIRDILPKVQGRVSSLIKFSVGKHYGDRATDPLRLLRPFWEHILTVHSATLMKVAVTGRCWPSGLQASHLNGIPNLVRLECLLPENMGQLECGGLRELTVLSDSEEGDSPAARVAVEGVKAFLRRATRLGLLDLRYWYVPAAGLLAALASSERSELQKLILSEEAAEHPVGLHLQGLPVETVILREDESTPGVIGKRFLEDLSAQHVPQLTVVEGRADYDCVHLWIHKDGNYLRNALVKNPQLHLLVSDKCCDEVGSECEVCVVEDCHPDLDRKCFDEFWGVVIFSHDADSECSTCRLLSYWSFFRYNVSNV